MHWKNSRFQIVSFIVGQCHTPDEAYRKALLLRDERIQAVNNAKATLLKRQAAKVRAKRDLDSTDEAMQLEAQAALTELADSDGTFLDCLDEAKREVAFLDEVLAKLDPYRKYKSLPEHEGFQLAQREEWCLELLERAQNYLLCTGTIPTDHFATMRSHPDFATLIAPAIIRMRQVLSSKENMALFNFKHKCIQELVGDKQLMPGPALTLKLEAP